MHLSGRSAVRLGDTLRFGLKRGCLCLLDTEKFDQGPELAKFELPTLVIAGRYDANSAPVDPFKVHKAIAGSRFVVFEHNGHLLLCEEPEMFLNVVESFLA